MLGIGIKQQPTAATGLQTLRLEAKEDRTSPAQRLPEFIWTPAVTINELLPEGWQYRLKSRHPCRPLIQW